MWWPARRSSVTPFRWSLAIDRLNTVAVQHFSWIIYLSMTKRCVFVIAFYQNAFHCLWNADNLLIGVTTHRQTTPIAVMALPRRRYVPRSQAFSLSLCRGSDPGSAHKPRRRRETAPVELVVATAGCRAQRDRCRSVPPLTARSRLGFDHVSVGAAIEQCLHQNTRRWNAPPQQLSLPELSLAPADMSAPRGVKERASLPYQPGTPRKGCF